MNGDCIGLGYAACNECKFISTLLSEITCPFKAGTTKNCIINDPNGPAIYTDALYNMTIRSVESLTNLDLTSSYSGNVNTEYPPIIYCMDDYSESCSLKRISSTEWQCIDTKSPCHNWTPNSTKTPTSTPTQSPTKASTSTTKTPSTAPTFDPTQHPTHNPTHNPSDPPSNIPSASTGNPTNTPSKHPSHKPSTSPVYLPLTLSSTDPSYSPSKHQSDEPSTSYFYSSSTLPSTDPSYSPSTIHLTIYSNLELTTFNTTMVDPKSSKSSENTYNRPSSDQYSLFFIVMVSIISVVSGIILLILTIWVFLCIQQTKHRVNANTSSAKNIEMTKVEKHKNKVNGVNNRNNNGNNLLLDFAVTKGVIIKLPTVNRTKGHQNDIDINNEQSEGDASIDSMFDVVNETEGADHRNEGDTLDGDDVHIDGELDTQTVNNQTK